MTKLSLDEEIAIRKFTGCAVGPVLRARQGWRWLRQAWHVVRVPVIMGTLLVSVLAIAVFSWFLVSPAAAILCVLVVLAAAGAILEVLA